MVNWTSLMPPNPSRNNSLKKTETTNNGDGRTFLGLLRTYERAQKQDDDDDGTDNDSKLESLESEIICKLQSMQATYLRRGLLKGDVDRAEELISKAEKNNADGGASSQQGGGVGKRRKRGGASGNKSVGIFNSKDIVNSESGSSIGDEVLVMSSLNRILGGSSKETSIFSCDIVKAAADVLMSICHFINTNVHLTSASVQVEHDLIIGMHSQLLNGIVNTMNSILEIMQTKDLCDEDDVEVEALSSCCKAAARIISIVGTRLSRSAKLIEKIKSTSEIILFHRKSHEAAMRSSAALLATLPLVGNMDGVPPQKLWTEFVQNKTKSLCAVLNAFFPLQRSGSKYSAVEGDQAWMECVKNDIPTQTDRLVEFQRRIEGTLLLLLSLLNLDSYNSKTQSAMAHAAVPINELLDLSEFMLAFPIAAETKYFSTKTRLRDISVENGLLSPNGAMMVANMVRYYGHELFDSCVSSLQSNSLLYGKRIIRVAFASLHSCSSLVVNKAVDPSSVEKQHEGKKRRWLHCSIELRIKAIKSIKTMILAIGSNVVITQTTIVNKILKLVIGCLFEQIEMQSFTDLSNSDWGAMKDRVLLTEICIDVLADFISVCIGFLPSSSRSLIDSVATTCFDALSKKNNSCPTLTFACVKIALLKLATNCICAPYYDGAANTLASVVHDVSSMLRFDRNPKVSSTAYSTLCVCNALMAQRAPPLVMTTQSSVAPSMNHSSASNTDLISSGEFMETLKSTVTDTLAIETSNRKRQKADDSGKDQGVLRDNLKKRQKKSGQEQDHKLTMTSKGKTPEIKSNKQSERLPNNIKQSSDNKSTEKDLQLLQKTSVSIVDISTKEKIKRQFPDEQIDESENNSSTVPDKTKSNGIKENEDLKDESCSDDENSEDDFPQIVDCDPDE